MAMKNDTKFQEELIYHLTFGMRNLSPKNFAL